jgi:hypothetical protein
MAKLAGEETEEERTIEEAVTIGLLEIGTLWRAPCTMPDMQNLHALLLLKHPVKHTINVRPMAVIEFPHSGPFSDSCSAVWLPGEACDALFQACEPFFSGDRRFSVDSVKYVFKVAASPRHDFNDVCHVLI